MIQGYIWLSPATSRARARRLGHAIPDFTMSAYQHVLPGTQAKAAAAFSRTLKTACGKTQE